MKENNLQHSNDSEKRALLEQEIIENRDMIEVEYMSLY